MPKQSQLNQDCAEKMLEAAFLKLYKKNYKFNYVDTELEDDQIDLNLPLCFQLEGCSDSIVWPCRSDSKQVVSNLGRLNPNATYALRTGEAGGGSGHFQIMYYEQEHWKVYPSKGKAVDLTDKQGNLSERGESAFTVFNEATSGNQYEATLVELNPRRLELTAQYLLDVRLLGEGRATNNFLTNMASPDFSSCVRPVGVVSSAAVDNMAQELTSHKKMHDALGASKQQPAQRQQISSNAVTIMEYLTDTRQLLMEEPRYFQDDSRRFESMSNYVKKSLETLSMEEKLVNIGGNGSINDLVEEIGFLRGPALDGEALNLWTQLNYLDVSAIDSGMKVQLESLLVATSAQDRDIANKGISINDLIEQKHTCLYEKLCSINNDAQAAQDIKPPF